MPRSRGPINNVEFEELDEFSISNDNEGTEMRDINEIERSEAEIEFDDMAERLNNESMSSDNSNFIQEFFSDESYDNPVNSTQDESKIVIATNDLRKKMRQGMGTKAFSELSTRSLEKLKNSGIHSAHDLLSSSKKTSDIESMRDELIGNKFLSRDDIKDMIKTYKAAYIAHEGRGMEAGSSIAFDDEAHALEEFEYVMADKGINSAVLESLINASSENLDEAIDDAFEASKKTHERKKFLKGLHINSSTHEGNKEKMDEIIGRHSIGDLDPEQLAAYKNRRSRENPADPGKLKEALQIINGPILKESSLDQAIEHLSTQQKALFVLDQNDPLYKDYKASFDSQVELLAGKGMTTVDIFNMVKNYGTDKYAGLKATVMESVNTSYLLETDIEDNLTGFYDRLGKAFDVKHHDIGSALSKENVKETIDVLREMKGYKKQLHLNGKISEANHLNNHIEKISKFLIKKGVSKEAFKDLIDCDKDKVKEKSDAFIDMRTKVESSKTAESSNVSVKRADGKIQITINLGEEKINISRDIEQFNDVKMIPDMEQTKTANKTESPSVQQAIENETSVVNNQDNARSNDEMTL